MKKTSFCLLFLVLSSSLWSISRKELPHTFFVEDQSGRSTLYHIKTNQKKLGIASQELRRLSSSFELKNTDQKLLVKAQSTFYCWGIVAHIWNPLKKKIGWIEKQSFKWFAKPICRIYDQNDQLVGIAQKNFWGNRLKITNPEDNAQVYAVIERPWHRFSNDLWQVHIHDETPFINDSIDPSILVLLATYDSNQYQESKAIELTEDDLVFINQNGLIQIGLEVDYNPELKFGPQVTKEQQEQISYLYRELLDLQTEFPNNLCKDKQQIKKDELEVQSLLETLDTCAAKDSDLSHLFSFNEISYAEHLTKSIDAEINRQIKVLDTGINLLKNPAVSNSQKESLNRILNEFFREMTTSNNL